MEVAVVLSNCSVFMPPKGKSNYMKQSTLNDQKRPFFRNGQGWVKGQRCGCQVSVEQTILRPGWNQFWMIKLLKVYMLIHINMYILSTEYIYKYIIPTPLYASLSISFATILKAENWFSANMKWFWFLHFQQVVPYLLPALSAVSTQRPEVCHLNLLQKYCEVMDKWKGWQNCCRDLCKICVFYTSI